MRHGLHFVPTPPVPTAEEQMIHFAAQYGVPVVLERQSKQIARAAGVWPRKSIVVNGLWCVLPYREREAVLLHEFQHCRGLHMEWRLAFLLAMVAPWIIVLPWPVLAAAAVSLLLYFGAQEVAYRQEYKADQFAVARGFGVECLQFIQRGGDQSNDPFHPPHGKRVEKIVQRIKEREDAATA